MSPIEICILVPIVLFILLAVGITARVWLPILDRLLGGEGKRKNGN